MTWLVDDRPLRRVLVSRLRYLGDVVMATAVTGALRRGDPGLEIGFLCEDAHAPVLAGHPDLARVHALAIRRHGGDARARGGPGRAGGGGTLAMLAELRRCRYDAVIDLFFNPRSAWLLRLTGIPVRLAGPAGSRRRLYTHASASGDASWPPRLSALAPGGLGDHLSRLSPLTHAETGLRFAEWFAREAVPARTLLAPRDVTPAAEGRPLLLAPGATWASKRWPAAHWRDLAAALARQDGWRLRVVTPPGAAAMIGEIVAGLPRDSVVQLPELALPAVLDELAASAGLVAADGGVMHASVALGVPTLAIFGPTDPRLWFPYEGAGPFRVIATRPPCHPCDRHECAEFVCLPDLGAGTVLAAARGLFGGSGRSR